jgi:hypothetical protein
MAGGPPVGAPPAPGPAAQPTPPAPPGVAGVPTEAMPLPPPGTPDDPGGAAPACPDCGAARTGRFCEECGYDYSTRTSGKGIPGLPAPAPSHGSGSSAPRTPAVPPGAWEAVVTADPDYHASVVAQGGPDTPAVPFPPYYPERRVVLSGQQVRIGRHSASRGVTPEIDLGERPEDPGVSHIHAVLLARSDGSWALVDPGSTNGTTVNGAADPIANNIEVPLRDGDRVHVGAWTTITLHKAQAEGETR